jgi:N-acetyl-anhydromuramyl-L-alanine amidase AmpD
MENLIPAEIDIHHSAEFDTPEFQTGGIRKWHMGTPPNGPADGPYEDIAYHALIEHVNNYPEIIIGRMWNHHGAHTLGHNGLKGQPHCLGVCLVGNFMTVPPPDDQLQRAVKFVKFLMTLYNIPIFKVYRHKDLNPGLTECPGAMFPWDSFKAMLG